MRKLWLDVTGLGTGPASGWDAVASDGIRSALDSGDEIGFCRFDRDRGFVDVPAGVVHQMVNAVHAAPAGLRGMALRLIDTLPAATQPQALQWARSAAALAGLAEREPPLHALSAAECPFERGDTVFVGAHSLTSRARAHLHQLRGERRLQCIGAPFHGAAATSPVEQWARARVAAAASGRERLCIALAASLYGGESFEDRLQHLYTAWLRPGDRCIDIGAHTGRHALPMAAAVGANGEVHAFEPNPGVADILRRRVQALGLGNLTVEEVALSDEAGSAEFVMALDRPEESGLKQRSAYNGPTRTERVTVQLKTLDSLGLPAPRFIKLDTEGAEFKVLLGARALLAQARPVIAFEFGHDSYSAYGVDPREVHRYLASLGYEVNSILGQALDEDAFAEASVRQDFWDYVACSRDESARVQAILRGGFAPPQANS